MFLPFLFGNFCSGRFQCFRTWKQLRGKLDNISSLSPSGRELSTFQLKLADIITLMIDWCSSDVSYDGVNKTSVQSTTNCE